MESLYHKYGKMSQDGLDIELLESCKRDQVDNVAYLLTSPELTRHANIDAHGSQPIITACLYGSFKVAKFLLQSPLLKRHANLNVQDNLLFKTASIQQRKEFLEFMINDMGLEKNEEIIKYLKDFPDVYAERLFLKRELNNELPEQNNIDKKSIKI